MISGSYGDETIDDHLDLNILTEVGTKSPERQDSTPLKYIYLRV